MKAADRGSRVTRSTALDKLELLHDVRELIEQVRSAVAGTVNAGLPLLYWRIGKRVNDETQKGARAEYGERIVASLSQELPKDKSVSEYLTALPSRKALEPRLHKAIEHARLKMGHLVESPKRGKEQ